MLEPGSYIVYKQQVCKVKGIIEKYYHDKDYYYLIPVVNEKLKIMLPVDQEYHTRPLMSVEKAAEIIEEIGQIDIIDGHGKFIKDVYKNLYESDDPENLVKIIKTAYVRSKSRQAANKKITASDEMYFEKAEKYLFSELSVVLDKSMDEIKSIFKEKAKL